MNHISTHIAVMKRSILLIMLIVLGSQSAFSTLFYYLSEHFDKALGGFTKCVVYDCQYNEDGATIKSKKKIRTVTFDDKGNMIENVFEKGGKTYRQTWKYDSMERQIEYIGYKKDGSVSIRESSKFDEKGRKIEGENYNSENNIHCKLQYKYDDNGNEIEEFNNNTGYMWKKTYKYNDFGKILEEIRFNYNNPFDREVYTSQYDGKGNIIEMKLESSNGKDNWKKSFKYDDIGRLTEKNEDGFKWTYVYDNKGNIIEKEKKYSNSPVEEKFTYKYDNKGNKIFESNLSDSIAYKYDDKGKLNEQVRFDRMGQTHIDYSYKYDEYGNLIEKVSYSDDKPYKKTEYIYSR